MTAADSTERKQDTHATDATSDTAGDAAASEILVVGPRRFEQLVREAAQSMGLRGTVHRVDNYLMALGHLGKHHPAAVVGHAAMLDDTASATGAALRRLAPTALLLLVADVDNERRAAQAVLGGFDDCLATPATAQDIASALAPLRLNPRDDATAPNAAPSPSTATADEAKSPATPVDSRSTLTQAAYQRESIRQPSAAAEQSLVRGSVLGGAFPPKDDELGDVDLVEHLIHGRGSVQALALQLIAGRSGLAGVRFSTREVQVPSGHVCVPIEFDGQLFGHLSAAKPASVTQLQPWAAWLSRWLALDHRMLTLWDAAFRDELTDVWNRRYFNRYLGAMLERAAVERFRVTVMIFDIDDFKTYNDRYGHPAGDEILREAARLMRTVVREHDVVARIGGDEFGVIFWDAEEPRRPNSQHPLDVRQATERFRKAIRDHHFPKLLNKAPGTLTISGGLAGFPWDGRTAEQLIELADARALQSKRQGKNALTFGPGAE